MSAPVRLTTQALKTLITSGGSSRGKTERPRNILPRTNGTQGQRRFRLAFGGERSEFAATQG